MNVKIYGLAPDAEAEKKRSSSVVFPDAKSVLPLFGKGLCRKHLQARPLQDAPSYLANVWRPFPFSDGKIVYLPAYLDLFPSRHANWRIFRLYAAVQAEQWEAGTFDRPRGEEAEFLWGRQAVFSEEGDHLGWLRFFLGLFPFPGLAGDIFITLETARTATAMARRFHGLAADLKWFLRSLNTSPEFQLYRGLLWHLFFTLLSRTESFFPSDHMKTVWETARRVISSDSELRDTLLATLTIYEILEPLAQAEAAWGTAGLTENSAGFLFETLPGPDTSRNMRFARAGKGEPKGAFPADLHAVLERLTFIAAKLPAGTGSFLTSETLKQEAGEKTETKSGTSPEATLEAPAIDGKRFAYPEWDHLTGAYRRNWVTLYQRQAEKNESGEPEDLLEGLDDLVREVRRQFRMLYYQEYAWRRRLLWGEELDLNEVVRREVERRTGLSPSEKLYAEKRRIGREVSALFLLDLSASTGSKVLGGIHGGKTVLRVLKTSVAVMACALEEIADRYGVFGFSGYGRKQVELLHIKSFRDALTDDVWQRLGGLQPMKSTRMGAAVRHARYLLEQETAPLKLMLVLSDGYPQDHDYGEDRSDREYGLNDTAQSLREAEANDILPFCVTVDVAGHDYLRRLCPPHRYLVLKSVQDLPAELPKVYLRLRGP